MIEELLRLIFGGFGGGQGTTPEQTRTTPVTVAPPGMSKGEFQEQQLFRQGKGIPFETIHSDLGDPFATMAGMGPRELLPTKAGLEEFLENERIWKEAEEALRKPQDNATTFNPSQQNMFGQIFK